MNGTAQYMRIPVAEIIILTTLLKSKYVGALTNFAKPFDGFRVLN